MELGAWQAIVCGVAKESDVAQWLNSSNRILPYDQQDNIPDFRYPQLSYVPAKLLLAENIDQLF